MLNASVIKGLKSALLTTALFAASHASADIVISGTRIVYPESSKDVIVNLDNRGEKPLLVQSWLDDGRDETNPEELKLPFVITPPVSRIDPKQGQSLRITYVGKSLPNDRESLFWFNVLEIPPKPKNVNAENTNQLQLAFRTRIKFFFRPDGLKGSALEAADRITWHMKKEGSNVSLVAHNDSPYNVAVSMVKFKSGQKSYEVSHQSLLPFSDKEMAVKGLTTVSTGTVTYETINDHGGVDDHVATLK